MQERFTVVAVKAVLRMNYNELYYIKCDVLQGFPALKKSLYSTCVKITIIITRVCYHQSATDTSLALDTTLSD